MPGRESTAIKNRMVLESLNKKATFELRHKERRQGASECLGEEYSNKR